MPAAAPLPPPVAPASNTAGAGRGGAGHAWAGGRARAAARHALSRARARRLAPPRACASEAGAEIQIRGAVGVVVLRLAGGLRERTESGVVSVSAAAMDPFTEVRAWPRPATES